MLQKKLGGDSKVHNFIGSTIQYISQILTLNIYVIRVRNGALVNFINS